MATRRIYCLVCGGRWELTPTDLKVGLRDRKVQIKSVIKPEKHGFEMNGRFHPVELIMCDTCYKPIHNGAKAIAVTTWREDREEEPAVWENEFGQL